MKKGWRSFDPLALRIESSGGIARLFAGAEPVRTPGGAPVEGPRRFVELVRREAEIARGFDPHALSAYALYAAQKDHVEKGRDPIERELDRILDEEEPLLDAGEGPEEDARRAFWPFVDAHFDTREPARLRAAVPAAHRAAPPAARTAVALLYRTHHAGVIVPLMLALGRCTASEYAEALLAMHRAHPRVVADADWKAYADSFVIAREDATIVEEYLTIYRSV